MTIEITEVKPPDNTQAFCAMCRVVILIGTVKILNRAVCLECKQWMDYLAELEKIPDGDVVS